MCSMCHHCGAELTISKVEQKRKENGNLLKLNDQDANRSCKLCQEKQQRESINRNGLSPNETPAISPTTSLSSTDSCISSCSDYSVDVNSYDNRADQEGAIDSSQDVHIHRQNGRLDNSSARTQVNGIARVKECNNGNDRDTVRDTVRDVEIKQTSNSLEAKENGVENCRVPFTEGTFFSPCDDELDSLIWEPPEPEDPEDDMEGSVAYNDDEDDEFGDGTIWGQPSSLSLSRDEGSGSYRFKEEKQRAIQEVINGKFKALVHQLLKSVGVTSSKEGSESWVDIVASLSWEAASFLKPNATDGKAMDPDGYVKVKCIATGSRSESQVIKGLVFKKHAAHKHMPTNYKNPRLLLIRGVLGQSSSGLSSFKSMEQEKDYMKSIIEMIEMCQPNVVLVEKTASRDIQESLLAKGMTLVFDMKLHRLERVARCTGSPIVSTDTLMNQKLKHCDSFYFKKFVEEHSGFGEGGKKPSKTLMFLDGCPTRLGCTILLKGSHSEELKRIKCVVQCAVVMAYHLILETSFLVDQRAMFSTIPFAGLENVSVIDQQSPNLASHNSSVHSDECYEKTELSTIDIPISNGFHEVSHDSNLALEGNSPLLYEPYNPVIFSGLSSLSASLKKVLGDSFPLTSYPSISSYFGFNESESNGQIMEEVPVSTTLEVPDHVKTKGSSDEIKSVDGGQPLSLSAFSETSLSMGRDGSNNEDQIQNKDDINKVLDSQSILVLMSMRNAMRGTICEQSHFSHIKFYRNFDVPLGKFLRDNILNQRKQCSTCSELPEAHFYYYAHRNKQLMIQVKRIPSDKLLPGEAEGRLWMWSRCGKCKSVNGKSKSTKRVLISTAARGLSFGKFLELSFCHHSSSSDLASCGHSMHRDFLYFFGLGPMVAMFRYSLVVTYTISVPHQELEFNNLIKPDWLEKETENVYRKGISMFTEVENALTKMRSQFNGSMLKLFDSLQEFSDIEQMCQQEKSEFTANIQNVLSKNGNPDRAGYKLLSLNWLLWELLLASCIWDRRLNSLLSPDPTFVVTGASVKAMQENMDDAAAGGNEAGEVIFGNGETNKSQIPAEGLVQESEEQNHVFDITTEHHDSGDDTCQVETVPLSDNVRVDRTIPISSDLDHNDSSVSKRGTLSSRENSNDWFWMPFSEIRLIDIWDLQRVYLQKFGSKSSHTQEYLPTVFKLLTEEGSRLHIPLGTDHYMLSDHEGELSSIIACALALLKDQPFVTEVNEGSRRDGGLVANTTESLHNLIRVPTVNSPHWSSNGSLDSDTVHSTASFSSDESRFSSFDGLNLLDSLVTPETLNAEVSLGVAKSLGKGKYSVICLYANQFRDLRNQCCPSEIDYIASLSRCMNWDAKGGKSKSFFAKTLDDRFIIKEIKRTEFESFAKFAPHYFNYMNQSFELGNQTCLAKVLGIYQVTVRQTKSGKETKHDLMVMENLTYGRNITRQYDLKGALHARYNSAANGSGDVLLDQNFVNDMNSSPLYVSNKAKRLLQRAVWNDTTFLNSIQVMDYSLLVGVDSQGRELVCGIIDYLRQYTWDKQLETWVKSSLVVPKNVLPTVISPIEYKKRFRKFMSTHFLSVPDHWCSERSSTPCELCGLKEVDSSHNLLNDFFA